MYVTNPQPAIAAAVALKKEAFHVVADIEWYAEIHFIVEDSLNQTMCGQYLVAPDAMDVFKELIRARVNAQNGRPKPPRELSCEEWNAIERWFHARGF